MTARAQTWHACVPLFLAACLVYGYNNATMTLLPTFVQAIGGSPFQAGLQGSVFLAAAVALRFCLGPLADRVGAKPVMALGVAAFAAGGFLLMGCTAFWQVLCVRCIQAVGIAAFFPCATAFAANVAPAGRSGFFLGLYRLVVSASLLVGPSVAFGLADAVGYEAGFAALGACAAVALALVAALPAGPRRGISNTPPTPPAPHQEKGVGSFSAVHAVLAANPRALVAVLGATLTAALGYGLLFNFGASFVESVDPLVNAGTYFSLIGFGGLVANPVAGWLADRMRQERLLGCCLALTAVGVGLLGAYGSVDGAANGALFVASGLCVGMGYPGTMTCAVAIVACAMGPEVRSSALALQQNAIDLGIGCAGVAFGAIASVAGTGMAAILVGQGIAMLACTAIGAILMKTHTTQSASL